MAGKKITTADLSGNIDVFGDLMAPSIPVKQTAPAVEEKQVDNPFYYLENDKNILLGLDNNLQIKTILITNSGVNISIDNVSKNQIYNVANFYYMMENDLKGTKIYDKLYLESLAKLIKKRSVSDVNK